MPSSLTFASPLSRRRVLTLAGGTALAGASIRRSAAQEPPIITPVASPLPVGTPVAGPAAPLPIALPMTLDAHASPEFQVVAEAVVAAMQQYQVPGAAIGLLMGDREEHAIFGVASLSSLRPVTPETLFQIGSLTKTYTATAIWRLINEGALALDAPVRTYIPELTLADETVAAEVTVANLLDHSAGWFGDADLDTGSGDDGIARYVSEGFPHLPQLFPVGEFFSYNNAALSLLGRLIEATTGTTYNAAMKHLLLGPLGLEDTLLEHAAVLRRPYADGHMAVPINGKPANAVQTPLWIPRSVDPAGGIWSTTRDVLRYGRFHLAAGTVTGPANVVSPDSLRQMREPSLPVPGLPAQMGLNWFVQDVDGTRAFWHNGDTGGQHTEFVAIPEQNFALVVLTNGQGGGTFVAMAALDATLAQFPDLAPLAGQIGLTHALLAPADAPTVDLAPEHLAAYAGRYAAPDQVMTFAETDEGLELTIEDIAQPGAWVSTIAAPPAPPAKVTFLTEDVALLGRLRLPFVRDPEGRVGWVGMKTRLVPRVENDA